MKSTGLRRRHLLAGCCAGLGAGLFGSLGLTPTPARAALRNPCLGALPAELARHDLVLSALQGLDVQRLVDTHAHLLGTGDSGSGCTVHESLYQWWRPVEVLRRKGILNAACVDEAAGSIDTAYVDRLVSLAAEFPPGARWWLFAFDRAHDDAGQPVPAHTTFHVPDAYAQAIARRHPARFDWVASIHPYRADAPVALDAAIAGGAKAIKWLPSSMNIDLRDARCKPFYDRLAGAALPLVVHCGEEHAVPGARRDELGNPLHVRAALERGVTVVMAHCGSLGKARDEDQRSLPEVASFDLFARLMDASLKDGTRLLGDTSAVFQRNRKPGVWQALVERGDWHARLLHGSDHPLPGVMPLFSLPRLVAAGVLDEADAPILDRVRAHNPLLFDLLLKRRLRRGGARVAAGVFEGRALTLNRA
jgi:mannonate dehydratase